MVYLTITPAIVEAFERLQGCGQLSNISDDPPLDTLDVGKPISHEQILKISKCLKQQNKGSRISNGELNLSHHLDDLLRGSQVYIEPPKPRSEPVRLLWSDAACCY